LRVQSAVPESRRSAHFRHKTVTVYVNAASNVTFHGRFSVLDSAAFHNNGNKTFAAARQSHAAHHQLLFRRVNESIFLA
jgi:hypothetical protein